MKKVFLMILGVASSLFAVNLPIAPTTEIVVARGQWSTISFPFEIKHIEKSPFVTKAVVPENAPADAVVNSEALLNASSLPQPVKKGKKKAQEGPKNIVMKRTKKSIEIYPYKYGSTQLVVYGYKQPMHVNIIVKKKAGADHFTFVDYGKKNRYVEEKADRFEMVSHEKVISKLIKYAYNNKVPPGYTQSRLSRSYSRNGMRFKLHKKIVGDRYQLNEWIVKNTAKGTVTLYEEMFYIDGIYAIAFDNNRLKHGESTRMFVVQKRDRS